ncbi:MAG: thiamine diphosphokinase [Candidatus Marinimicrobia bacterium]|nr:thiamine diphosphokinase [Candidatus Neomarinimicrobiota bacterium]MCF7905535.1 thiamine diphosphokinase [Candidatus Neomarinimicrobiota bacterium]
MKALFVLAGSPPSEDLLRSAVADADHVIAVDGGANVFASYQMEPDILIGDLDSVKHLDWTHCQVIQDKDQETTDLQKALGYINDNLHIDEIKLLGALGGRTDHLIHNLKICASINKTTAVQIVSDKPQGSPRQVERIYRLTASQDLRLKLEPGSIVSLFALAPFSGLSTAGLKWDLHDLDGGDSPISQSNLTIKQNAHFKLHAGTIYIAVYQ